MEDAPRAPLSMRVPVDAVSYPPHPPVRRPRMSESQRGVIAKAKSEAGWGHIYIDHNLPLLSAGSYRANRRLWDTVHEILHEQIEVIRELRWRLEDDEKPA